MIILGTIELPHFIWLNRFGYTPHVSSREFALDGSQHIEIASKQAGRSIVLYSEGEALAIFELLESHANLTVTAFELQINGQVLSVMWDFSEQAISGIPTINYSDGDPEQIDAITLKLITV
ncbi:hypothetical protein [Shewanella glacialimarina]|uniref:hypothetical protein n=1 Tax=Shewanella glacialimarina TaxID=2590884 RepID=UPI001CF8469A|nr:hypothetical protein [Shewanella glacialimarina]UCX05423.1 hypothetical protein FJ709_13560 [Shewanella glacialimarina]